MVANSMKQELIKADNRNEKGELTQNFIKTERKNFAQAFNAMNAGRRRKR